MSEKYQVGSVLEGKVTGIQPYGAFVAIDGDTQGLVHISEITHGFVKDVNEHLSVGDTVTVKVISVDEAAGKIGLSIRATQEAPKEEKKPERKAKPAAPKAAQTEEAPKGFNTLKEKLEEWIEQSDMKKN